MNKNIYNLKEKYTEIIMFNKTRKIPYGQGGKMNKLAVICIVLMLAGCEGKAETIKDSNFLEIDAPVFTSLTIRDVRISWEDGIVDVTCANDFTLTEAAKQFFEFLKNYINAEYDIIPKKKVNTCPACGSKEREVYKSINFTSEVWIQMNDTNFYICANCGNVYVCKEKN